MRKEGAVGTVRCWRWGGRRMPRPLRKEEMGPVSPGRKLLSLFLGGVMGLGCLCLAP